MVTGALDYQGKISVKKTKTFKDECLWFRAAGFSG